MWFFYHVISCNYLEIKSITFYIFCLRRNVHFCFSLVSPYFSSSLLSISFSCTESHVDSVEHPSGRGGQSSGTYWTFPACERWKLHRESLLISQTSKGDYFTLPKRHVNKAVRFCSTQQPWFDYQDRFIPHAFNRQLFFLNKTELRLCWMTKFSLSWYCQLHYELTLQSETETS